MKIVQFTTIFTAEVTDDLVKSLDDLWLKLDVTKVEVHTFRGVVAGAVKTYETNLVEQLTQ